MEREAQLEFCKICEKRKMDMQRGLVCSLTNEHAAFDETCPDFSKDETIEPPLYKVKAEELEIFRDEQRFIPGCIAALVVGLVGAYIWGLVTVETNFQIGWMAVAIGAGVGYTMRFVGKGIDPQFGLAGAGIALLSTVIGNILGIIGFLAIEEGISLLDAMFLLDYTYLPVLMMDFFSPVDILFYGIAAYEGYRFSFRKLEPEMA